MSAREPLGPALRGSAFALLRVSRRAVVTAAAAATMMALVVFPLAALPVALAVPVAVAVPADHHHRRRRDDDRRGRADVDVDVDGVGEAGQRKTEAGEGERDQRAFHVVFRDVVVERPARRDGREGGSFHRGDATPTK